MATTPPPPRPPLQVVPDEPGEPSNRWPWIALALGVLVIAIAVAFFFINRQRAVNVTVANPPTQAAIAAPSPPPTLVPPTLPPSATLAPTATPAPSPTPAPTATQPPASPTAAATQPPTPDAAAARGTPATAQPAQPLPPAGAAPATPAPTQAVPTQPAQSGQPTSQPAPTAPPTSAPTQPPAPSPSPTPVPSPTAFAGQVASAGGAGNTRADLDAALGAPVGETPDHLVVYRKGMFEYHVRFVPDPGGRNALLVGIPQAAAGQTPQPFTMDQAVAEAHRLLPKDAQPPNPPQEGNPQFVVERFTSQTLAQALPADAFTANKGQPGQFLIVYVRDPAQSTRATRFIIGPGDDPNALMNQGR